MDRMELHKINIELDEESNSEESTEDNYTEMGDPEKATISRYERFDCRTVLASIAPEAQISHFVMVLHLLL